MPESGSTFVALLCVSLCTFGAGALPAQVASFKVSGLKIEYKKNTDGVFTARIRNDRNAAVTAYLAIASYQDGYRERHNALGGDTLGFTNGEDAELPPNQEVDTGRPLPPGGTPTGARVLAVIYADGVTQGEDEVIAMLVAGRQRAYADLKECIPALEKAAAGQMKREDLLARFESMQARDEAEGASLDEIQDAPGRMRYRYFLSAVPAQGMQALQSGSGAATMLSRFRDWEKRLANSKPGVQ